MSEQRTLRWRSGRLTRTSLDDFWQLPINLNVADPPIPNLPIGGVPGSLPGVEYRFGTHALAIASLTSCVMAWGSHAALRGAVAPPSQLPAQSCMIAPQDATQIQPFTSSSRALFALGVPQLPQHAKRIAIAAQIDPTQQQPYWARQAPPTYFDPSFAQRPQLAPQDDPTQLQPIWFRQAPPTRFDPTVKPIVVKPQESPEQTQPQHSWSPALFAVVAAPDQLTRQFFIAPPQDPTQLQPWFARQAPPTFFDPSYRRALFIAPQDDPTQLQPQWSRQAPPTFFDASFARRTNIAAQIDPTQQQPYWARQAPPTRFDPTARTFLIEGQRQPPEQPQPAFARAFFAPALDFVPTRAFVVAAPQQLLEQPQPWTFKVPPPPPSADVPALRAHLFVAPQIDPTQIAPTFFHQLPPSIAAPPPAPLDVAVPGATIGAGRTRYDIDLGRVPTADEVARIRERAGIRTRIASNRQAAELARNLALDALERDASIEFAQLETLLTEQLTLILVLVDAEQARAIAAAQILALLLDDDDIARATVIALAAYYNA